MPKENPFKASAFGINMVSNFMNSDVAFCMKWQNKRMFNSSLLPADWLKYSLGLSFIWHFIDDRQLYMLYTAGVNTLAEIVSLFEYH